MDVKETFSKRKTKGPFSITAALTTAFLEWLLLIFLFMDGAFAYLVTKFAQYCQLQVPCLLCSRLDHVLGKEKAGFYWDLICPNHKLKISSLVLCHSHDNLVDVHGMCESCLFSFATVNKSNAETYRLLVGKLGADPHIADEDPLLEEQTSSSSGIRKCYCCREECVSRGYAQNLFKISSSCADAAQLDAPLSETKEIGNEPSVSVLDPLPHLEYKKVKVSSDSESEAAHSDGDSSRCLLRATDYSINDSSDRCLHPEPQIFTFTDDLATEKLIHSASVPEPSLLDAKIDFRCRDFPFNMISAAAVEHGLEEINWQKAEQKTDASAPAELITFDEATPLSIVNENLVDVARETSAEMVSQVVKDCGGVSQARSDEVLKTEAELHSKPETNETSLQTAGSFDLGDAYKLAVGNRSRQLSGKFLEQMSFKDSTRMSEDLKVLLTQLSSPRVTDTTLSEMSPRVSVNGEEIRTYEASHFIGMQILHKRISLERNESGLSLEGSAVSEIEGESVSDRLKRQVEYDRKLMAALYKELEEERNASSVAANQAMAMITRVQEEKAALNMEALQCLRVLEEQAEYDNEALQKANDLLVQKEKEIQDLEAELELYKKKLGNMALFDDALEASYDSNKAKQADTICSEGSSSFPDVNADIPTRKYGMSSREENIDKRSLILDFESERQQIMVCLNKLEERLYLFSKHEASQQSANVNSEFSTEEWVEVGNPKDLDNREIFRNNGEIEENVRLDPTADTSPSGEEVSTCKFPDESKSWLCADGDSELETLKSELSVLSSRLKALETEHCFLEHSINSLRNGDEGHRFIEEIAGHLRQLHFVWDRTHDDLARK
ncbi:myosin-binding protein 1-like isoform X2 [Nicotiana tabacum]|uniref:Myosin-binding protein 1-like isoform X2 n=3 Tax=Nicotiana tabacum TaxID=4097 RepID=A0A1S3Z797_TOBAC|nr:myosin-binding protein 1 isoform X2 [Nicotiana tomentosiformis]XP_016460229.1 PREDICTED: myosin-binding protein 1-like isoform X2 [Nicotiana tabacum]